MKKNISVLLAAAILFSLAACNDTTVITSESANEAVSETLTPEETAPAEAPAAEKSAGTPESTAAPAAESKPVFTESVHKSSDYGKAQEAMKNKDYAAASELFAALGDYKESQKLKLECDYLLAKELYAGGEHEAAKKLFDALGSFGDSAELSKKCADGILTSALLGKWSTKEMNVSPIYMKKIKALFAEGVLDDFSFTRFVITVHLRFAESGSFVMALDEDSFSAVVDELIPEIRSAVLGYSQGVYEDLAEDYGLTMEELYAAMKVKDLEGLFYADIGSTVDEYVESIVSREYLMSFADDYSANGTYEVKDGEILLRVGTETSNAEYNTKRETLKIFSEPMNEFLTFKKMQ